ncbi:monovalent cation/H+ antiporter complex subunit F [Myxococcota bacterium]|nr:monovalent cation/H+ antiporter complex subunit F [Myxococcota bacterium]
MTCEVVEPQCIGTVSAMAMLSAGLVLAVLRLLRGPSTPDRVVALDLTGLLVVGMIAVYAVMTDDASLLTGALVLGLVAFLGAVAFAGYLERKVDR